MITTDIKFPAAASDKNLKIDIFTQPEDSSSGKTNKKHASDNYKKAIFTKRHLFIIIGTFLLFIGAAFSFYLLQSEFQEINLSRMDTLGGVILLIPVSYIPLTLLTTRNSEV